MPEFTIDLPQMVLIISAVFIAFHVSKLQTGLNSLAEAISEMKGRDETIGRSLVEMEKQSAVVEIYKQRIDDVTKLANRQGQYIGRLLEARNMHDRLIEGIMSSLKENDIQVNTFVSDKQQNQIGEGNEQS